MAAVVSISGSNSGLIVTSAREGSPFVEPIARPRYCRPPKKNRLYLFAARRQYQLKILLLRKNLDEHFEKTVADFGPKVRLTSQRAIDYFSSEIDPSPFKRIVH
jgi:hypothetical protein